jgi:excisionase family DNA binding protein
MQRMSSTVFHRLVSSLMPPLSPSPLTISFKRAAELTCVCEMTLRRLAAKGRLRTVRFGTRVLINLESLEEFVRQEKS